MTGSVVTRCPADRPSTGGTWRWSRAGAYRSTPGTWSRAQTRGISVVPGFAKQTVTQADAAARRATTAPVREESEAGFVRMEEFA